MPTVTLTAFDSVTATAYSGFWTAAAAGWGGTPDGDTGTNTTPTANPLFTVTGLLTDDGTTIPADAVISEIHLTYAWVLESTGTLTLQFTPLGDVIAAPGDSGTADELYTEDDTMPRATFYAIPFGWTLASGSSGDGRAVVSSFAVVVTYSTPVPVETISAGGDPGTLFPRVAVDVSISDALDEAPNTASFTVTPRPPDAAHLLVEAFGERLFRGNLQSITQTYEGRPTQLAHGVTAIDRTWLLNKYVPFVHVTPPVGVFVNVPADDVVLALMAYAPEFDVSFVQTGLRPISIRFDGTEELSTCLTRVAAVHGSCHWYIGLEDVPDLHFFYTPQPAANFGSTIPGPTTASVVAETANVYSNPLYSSAPGFFKYRVRYHYDDGAVSAYGPISNLIRQDGAHTIDFSALPIGPPEGSRTVIGRQVFYDFVNAYHDLWNPFFEVLDNTTTSLEFDISEVTTGGLTSDAGGPGFDTYGPPSQPMTRPAGPGAVTASLSGTTNPCGDGQTNDTSFVFAMTCVYADDTESLLGTAAAPVTQPASIGLSKLFDFTSVPIGASAGGVPVVYRKLYAAIGEAVSPTPTFDPVDGYGILGWLLIPDNTSTAFDDADHYFNCAFKGFTFDGFPHVYGPDLEGDDDPDPIDDTTAATVLLHEPRITESKDWSQVRNRVFVQGAGTLFVERNDYAAQAQLALTEGGDGVHEYPVIVDTNLTTLAAVTARAEAEILLYARPIQTVTFATRTPMKSGKTITISLTSPPIQATLKIQAVAIDQVVISNVLTPRYTVTASSVRFTLDDLLRRIA